jgi:formylglycine-generating enzyme required for sulfatase activity
MTLASLCYAQDPRLYAVIDLSGGPTTNHYPVTFTNEFSPGGDEARIDKLVLRKITDVANADQYYMGVFEVTKGQFNHVVPGFMLTPNTLPLTATDFGTPSANFDYFVNTLNLNVASDGYSVSYPSQDEWSFACRADTPSANAYFFGDDASLLTNYAWYADNAASQLHAAGGQEPSPWGLYDTYGNVAEICAGSFEIGTARGGHYASPAAECTTAYTSGNTYTINNVPDRSRYGFRILMRSPASSYLSVIGGQITSTNGVALSDAVSAGSYPTNISVTVSATNTSEDVTFVKWLVAPQGADLGLAFIETSPTASLVTPSHDVTLTASNKLARFPLTVNYASGSGMISNGVTVTVGQTLTYPTSGHEFDHWEGDTDGLADLNAAPTTFIMPAAPATLTAFFRPKKVLQQTYMVVPMAGGAASYMDEPPAGGWTDVDKTTQMVFRKIPAGSFAMGSPAGEAGYGADAILVPEESGSACDLPNPLASEAGDGTDETQHAVTLTKDFYLGIFEVTQEQWRQGSGSSPSHFVGNTLPVEQVSYSDVLGFLASLGTGYTLPTEAQWEYACRAKSTGTFNDSNVIATQASALDARLDPLGWFAGNSANTTHATGAKTPNAWGLYDMHGNVWEICRDWYTDVMPATAQTDPTGPGSPPSYMPALRVIRGGAFWRTASYARSACRWTIPMTNLVTGSTVTSNNHAGIGFRVAVPQTTASYLLAVVNGVVNTGGIFSAGTVIGLSPAEAPAGQKFGAWQRSPAVDLGASFSATTAQTLLTMPASAVTVAAVYISTNSTGLYHFLIDNPGSDVELWQEDGATFAITAPAPAAGYRFNGWTVSPAGTDLGAGFTAASASTTVTMPALDVTVTPTYVLNIPDIPAMTPTAGVLFTLDAGEGQRPATFSAKGLPTGLRIDRTTGVISGIPSRTGTFTVQVTAKHSDGTTITYDIAFSVQALASKSQGTFTGYLYSEVGGGQPQLKALVSLKVSAKGRLSAKVTTQKTSYSFSAASWSEATAAGLYRVALERRQGERLELEVDSADGTLSGTLSTGTLGSTTVLTVVGQRNAFLDRADTAAQSTLSAYKGYYTVALPVVSCETDLTADNAQSGSGYLTITVRDRGAVKVAGKLADGTRVSASTTLLADSAGAYVPLFVNLYSRRGTFAGLLQLAGGTVPTAQRVSDAAAVRLEWLYPGRSVALTGDSFNAKLSATGAYYDTLSNIQDAYAGTAFQAEGFPWLLPVIPGSSGSLVIAADAVANPNSVKLKGVRRTGLFSGSFKAAGENGRTVTLKYAGVLTRDGANDIGDGAYIQSRKVNVYTLKSSFRVLIAD